MNEEEKRNMLDWYLRNADTREIFEAAKRHVAAQRATRDAKAEILAAEYEAWNKAQGLNLGSADEHLFDGTLTGEQREWLRAFVSRWDDAKDAFIAADEREARKQAQEQREWWMRNRSGAAFDRLIAERDELAAALRLFMVRPCGKREQEAFEAASAALAKLNRPEISK